MLEIFIINALSDNYVYLLRNEHKNITIVIDPGESEPVLKFLHNKNWHLDEIINTHHHHDHIGGNNELLDLGRKITLFHAKIIKDLNIKEEKIIIGFHGQTIYHNSEENISFQLGDGKLLSQLTRKRVVFNFRKNGKFKFC